MGRISVLELQEILKDNEEAIIKIMVKLGFDKEYIKYHPTQHLITAKRPDPLADNVNGCLIYTNTLKYIYTTRNKNGNIFTLVMDIKQCSFKKSLSYISKWIDVNLPQSQIRLPFGGFYKKIWKSHKTTNEELLQYTEADLPPATSLSLSFFKDGIAYNVQEQWGIRYSHDDNATLIPIYDCNGNLVGCKARNNDTECDYSYRWYAYLKYSKTKVLFGYYENFKTIQQKSAVIIVESEKGVLQMCSFGCYVGVAVGGHSISTSQVRLIKSLMVKKIIIAFDQDLSEEEISYEAKKLISYNSILQNKVGYIYDKKGDYLPIGSKAAPTDYGKEIFKELIKRRVKWIE